MVSSLPVYIQIHDKIKDDIEHGVWKIETGFHQNESWRSSLALVE